MYVATGDAASGTTPQDLTSLGGKLLRISTADGSGVAGNPFAGSANPNTRRIFNWGHRNLQGLAHRPGTGQIWTAEHGPDRDDEVNHAFPGFDYGWNPVPGYNESVPMTRAGAHPAVWSSGPPPTVAPSGMAFLDGCQWGALDDHLAVADLRGSRLQVHGLTSTGAGLHLGLIEPAPLAGAFGRLRTVVRAPDGSLLVTTSNSIGHREPDRPDPAGHAHRRALLTDRAVRRAPAPGRYGRPRRLAMDHANYSYAIELPEATAAALQSDLLGI